MKTLYLLRHAKSDWVTFFSSNSTMSDHDRPLSKRGFADCKKISHYFTENKVQLDLVLISSALRAQETFKELKLHLDATSNNVDQALYTFSMERVIDVVRKCDNCNERLLLIGHNPAFQELAISLSDDKTISSLTGELESKFPTAALVRLDLNIDSWSQISPNCANLIHFVRPKDFKIDK